MTLAAGHFQTKANAMINTKFAAFTKTLIIRTADAPVYGTAQTYTTETGEGISLGLDERRLGNELINIGDDLIFTNASDWTVNPKADINDLIFDGVSYSIILVEKDADNAAYFLTVRAK